MENLTRNQLTRIELTTKTILVKESEDKIMNEIKKSSCGFITITAILERYDATGILNNKGKILSGTISISHIVSITPNTYHIGL